jgi:hypothetical protein
MTKVVDHQNVSPRHGWQTFRDCHQPAPHRPGTVPGRPVTHGETVTADRRGKLGTTSITKLVALVIKRYCRAAGMNAAQFLRL